MKEFNLLIPIERKSEIEQASATNHLVVKFVSENRFNCSAVFSHRNKNQSIGFQTIFDLGRLFETILNQQEV